MTLKELAQQYLEQDELIQKRISKERSRLETARGEELFCLRKNLRILYDMSRDLRRTADILKNYYGDDEE